MAVTEVNNYTAYAGYYIDAKKKGQERSEIMETTIDKRTLKKVSEMSESKAESEKKVTKEEYLINLEKRHTSLNIMAGGVNTNYRGSNYPNKVDVMIAPSILEEMASDPEAAKKYEKMLADIPKCEKWANSMIKAMTGNDVQYRQVWIDENGNMGSFSISGSSKKQKKQDAKRKENEQKAFEERLEKAREKAKERTEQTAEKMLEKKMETSKNGKLFLNNGDMQMLIQAAKEHDIKTSKSAAEKEAGVYFNASI